MKREPTQQEIEDFDWSRGGHPGGEEEEHAPDSLDAIPANEVAAYVASDSFEAEPLLGNLCRRGHDTVMSSLPKEGKTTYLNWLVATDLEARPLVWLTEMTAHEWLPLLAHWSREQMEEVEFIFADQVWGWSWPSIAGMLRHEASSTDTCLVIVETAREFWGLEQGQWNDPACVKGCLDEYRDMHALGVGVLTVHHDRKSGGEHGQGLSGSNAFAGHVSTICEFSRVGNGRKRRMKFTSRFPGAENMVVELQADGFNYEVEGDAGARTGVDNTARILTAIEAAGPSATIEYIVEATGFSDSFVRPLVKAAVKAGKVIQHGKKGKKGHPLRYSNSPIPSRPLQGGAEKECKQELQPGIIEPSSNSSATTLSLESRGMKQE